MRERLEVVTLSGIPTKVDVSILPVDPASRNDPTIDIVSVQQLFFRPRGKKRSCPFKLPSLLSSSWTGTSV